jgi:hypothetical protein
MHPFELNRRQIAYRERYSDNTAFLVFFKTSFNEQELGPISKEKIAAKNLVCRHPPQFKRHRSVVDACFRFQSDLAASLVDYISDFTERVTSGTVVSMFLMSLVDLYSLLSLPG